MLAGKRHHTRARRGIVLVLVLAMLGLLALIGVTFATFSGQARINARNFAMSVLKPQDDELMDFALQQLITDTADMRSAIRGHSLARDMFGNDAFNNGYLSTNPASGGLLLVQKIAPVAGTPFYDVLTYLPVPASAPMMFGYDFTRWTMRVSYIGTVTPGSPMPVSQTCEIILDDYQPGQSNTQFSGNGYHAFRISPLDNPQYPNTQTILNNPTLGYVSYNANNPFSGWPTTAQNATPLALTAAFNASNVANIAFTLDGRWLRAFNGPGMGSLNVTWPVPSANNSTTTNPLSTYGNFRFNEPLLQQAAIQLNPNSPPLLTGPNSLGMDEDYDACDLENWFLAIQSADGQVTIPSFHRPAVIRYDPNNPTATLQANDWGLTGSGTNFRASQGADSLARILRPVKADGHDAATFPDLTPDPVTGKINYDVDNDGDGVSDSVWVDLGYPSHRDSTGHLYKPLFAFMIIGLNGRIPLNTAGNLANTAGGGPNHAQHLGNSVSEIDPQYGLQNNYNQTTDFDPFNYLNSPAINQGVPWPTGGAFSTANTQVDNAINPTTGLFQSIDVRQTQFRNLLAGTRPQINPYQPDATGTINGDTNLVWGSWPGQPQGSPYALPNSIADGYDTPASSFTTTVGGNSVTLPQVQRTTTPVPGRWGEASAIPGVPFASSNGYYASMVQTFYANPVRAGYSFDMTDLLNNLAYNGSLYPFPREAADDNHNAFDIFPARLLGEVGDLDFYDAAGALILPVERMRRFVTPVDINGTGSVRQWAGAGNGPNRGADNFGRVQFNSYFRPAGSAGAINISPNSSTYPYGAISHQDPTNSNNNIPFGSWNLATGALTPWTQGQAYVPDVTNNPFHGYEWYKLPNTNQIPGITTTPPGPPPAGSTSGTTYSATNVGGMPVYNPNPVNGNTTPAPPPQYQPTTLPSYGTTASGNGTNAMVRSDGMNEADEMNLYAPNPLLDSPYGPSDLEWLYRQQDVDGATMTSRLSQLAPVSFTNTLDGQRRRRLYSLDSWESNSYAWTPDNPGGAFANNSRFTGNPALLLPDPSHAGAPMNVGNASYSSYSSIQTFNNNAPVYFTPPALAQRGKRINLNYPLPVSNDPNEPIRQKWISDTYQLLKVILPPTAVDSAEELAQLSQFVINIIDFRDPDATLTHWINPDVWITPGSQQTLASGPAYLNPVLTIGTSGVSGCVALDQYGMEYNPVAINEVLAYSYQSRSPQAGAAPVYTNRFFIELVNTLTAAYNPTYDGTTPFDANNYYGYGPTNTGGNQVPPGTTPPQQASTLDLGGFTYLPPANGLIDPYGAGCWDLVFTADNPMARPDPYRGELVNNLGNGGTIPATTYSLIPLNRDAMGSGLTNPAAPNGGDVTLLPISPNGIADPTQFPITNVQIQTSPPTNYFYVIGNNPSTVNENNPLTITPTTSGGANNNYPPPVTQFLAPSFDPMTNANATPPNLNWRPGILPGVIVGTTTPNQPPLDYQWDLPPLAAATGTAGPAQYYWVCLRRPANPFAPVSLANPMCVVDSMRFPFVDGSPPPTSQNWNFDPTSNQWVATGTVNTIYSAQRLQPYRGGHAVPMPNATGTTTTNQPPDPRYGYTEQIAVPQPSIYSTFVTNGAANVGNVNGPPSTNGIYQTLGYPNSGAENWDYFPFNDRDFTSVAELLLVPGCPPGLFTKQFAEFAPSQMNAANIFATVTPVISPSFSTTLLTAAPAAGSSVTLPQVYPTPFATATLPFLSVSQLTVTSQLGSNPLGQNTGLPNMVPPFSSLPTFYSQPGTSQNIIQPTAPVQPHAFPYLVDRFFYTGASSFLYPPNGRAMDPGSLSNLATYSTPAVPVVGGPGGDGWFRMFEFLEVPSQAVGAIGPVAQGANFDWARQDMKPGLMNLNLIIDEEAFYGVFGAQNSSGDYNQTLLNSIELPLLATYNANTGALTLPYNMPLSLNSYYNIANTVGNPPIPPNGPPVPLVVTASQLLGAPNYAYPVTDQTQYSQHGYLAATDPINYALMLAGNGGTIVPAPGNRIKAAFAQFLWSRHGGSGYLYGFGNGATGQNSAVSTPSLSLPYNGSTPSERPFHSLSYPDINLTIMRPAALPPSTFSNPAMIPNLVTPALTPVTNAAALEYVPSTAPTNWYLLPSMAAGAMPSFYAPYVVTTNGTTFPSTSFPANTPIVYSGDPGVRNPYFNPGYVTGAISVPTPTGTPPTVTTTPPYPVYLPIAVANPLNSTTNSPNAVPPGMPLPENVALPAGSVTNPPAMYGLVMPPPIPPARLFQVPDYFGARQLRRQSYMGIINANNTAQGNIPPALSNATDSGDPWINNIVANPWINPYISNAGTYPPTYTMTNYPPSYMLNNGFSSLPWSGGNYYSSASTAPPPVAATGVLPPTSIAYAPYAQYSYYSNALSVPPGPLRYYNGSAPAGTPTTSPYLGANSGTAGSATLTDDRQHPYWRTEMLQKAMNLTTVRTHQYAVWITVGFFEVKRQGDIAMLSQGAPQLAFDILGPEIGALNGQNVRFRGFFLVDRLKLTGFNPGDVGAFHNAIIYRNVIQ